MTHQEIIIVLDFGSQYTQLIARKVRELGVYSEIKPYTLSAEELRRLKPAGIIFSGGPASVYEDHAPLPNRGVFDLGIPILGICYGLQLTTFLLNGKVVAASEREYGAARLEVMEPSALFENIPSHFQVWMSHGDKVDELPPGFRAIARTENAPAAAIAHDQKRIFGLQFHPEVAHTEYGKDILKNFLFNVCGCRGNWNPANFIEMEVAEIRKKVGDGEVICALSGGVDSAVAAALVHRAVGERLHCIFVDTGLLRKGEADEVTRRFTSYFGSGFHRVDAGGRFFARLRGVTDPEQKRKRIGEEFIRIFEEEARRIQNIRYLVQGTLYPDVIESASPHGGPSVTIKTHHNVGGLPENMDLELIEPLRELFKDEVREVGRLLGLPEEIIRRHPFPGPGLAVRILGEVTPERVAMLQEADAIFISELKRTGWYDNIWQAFVVLLPISTVGVMGDQRTYENAVALRAVTSVDGMTADWGRLPHELLATVSNRIINQVQGINRVVYDISSKPPATIEWE